MQDNEKHFASAEEGMRTATMANNRTAEGASKTSDTYKPTKRLADSSETGPATIIISGLSLGMLSTVAPVVIICCNNEQ